MISLIYYLLTSESDRRGIDINAVRQKIATSKSDWLRQRWRIVYQALVEPKAGVAIAQELAL
jgi:hypothetical protein